MSLTTDETANEPPRGHVKVVYLGPVAPHWEIRSDFGERSVIDEFRSRTQARLLLLPPHDPQFRRNRERVVRDAERARLIIADGAHRLSAVFSIDDQATIPCKLV